MGGGTAVGPCGRSVCLRGSRSRGKLLGAPPRHRLRRPPGVHGSVLPLPGELLPPPRPSPAPLPPSPAPPPSPPPPPGSDHSPARPRSSEALSRTRSRSAATAGTEPATATEPEPRARVQCAFALLRAGVEKDQRGDSPQKETRRELRGETQRSPIFPPGAPEPHLETELFGAHAWNPLCAPFLPDSELKLKCKDASRRCLWLFGWRLAPWQPRLPGKEPRATPDRVVGPRSSLHCVGVCVTLCVSVYARVWGAGVCAHRSPHTPSRLQEGNPQDWTQQDVSAQDLNQRRS